MRDIDRLPVGDDAYANPSPAGFPPDVPGEGDEDPPVPIFEDPSFTDTQAYGKPSLGGEFGPGGVPVLSGPDDGGASALTSETLVTEAAPSEPKGDYAWPGRSRNASTRDNLYPWLKTPGMGLSSNRGPAEDSASSADAAPADVPEPDTVADVPMHGINLLTLKLKNGTGTVSFQGPAQDDAVVTIEYSIDGATMVSTVPVQMGDTATKIATRVRAALNDVGDLIASGTGGTVSVVAAGAGTLDAFNVTIE